jgi:hypothetical protein
MVSYRQISLEHYERAIGTRTHSEDFVDIVRFSGNKSLSLYCLDSPGGGAEAGVVEGGSRESRSRG